MERAFDNLDLVLLAAGTALLFPTAATMATLFGGAYMVAGAAEKYEKSIDGKQKRKLKGLQQEINRDLDKYRLELAIKLQQHGIEDKRIENYLDRIIKKEDFKDYVIIK